MARLNTEPPVSTDSLETLRRKLLRQNRDLAKSNNIRALRIRELENECSLMLSENLELRGKILELETQVEDNEARRIADHALSIKDKLEAQLTEWGTMLAGLGLEPPPKRHSPRARKSIIKQRMSFHSNRPSPSSRRLRDIARDVEELGHISENKSCPRQSMNPEQILALRSEADEVGSPELGPPPMSHFIDQDPVKMDSPTRTPEPSPPRSKMQPPIMLQSLVVDKLGEKPPSPEKKRETPKPQAQRADPESPVPMIPEQLRSAVTPVAQPIKIGSKRKFAAQDENDVPSVQITSKGNRPAKALPEKGSVLGKAEGKTLKELATMRKEARDRATTGPNPRKPLSAKSTNNDPNSPKKMNVAKDEVAAAKADMKPKADSKPKLDTKTKAIQDRPKVKSKPAAPKGVLTVELPIARPSVAELAVPVADPVLLLPASPEPTAASEEARGDTPPPAHISSSGETSRASRRNRSAVSYAEPNLRDKMRRPSKQLFDAVAGEAYTRRSSQSHVKRESDVDDVSAMSMSRAQAFEADVGMGSPLASKSTSNGKDKRSRQSSVGGSATEEPTRLSESSKEDSSSFDSDVYDFNDSSPQVDKLAGAEPAKSGRRQSKASRRHSEAVDADEVYMPRERGASRRRSMML